MRWMILRMIATGSLSAFSTAVPQGPAALPAGTAPLRTAKASVAPATTPKLSAPAPGAAQPARTLPRGSLLDLSV